MTKTSTNEASYRGKYFVVDGKPIYLYSGEFHYFRTPRALWADRILKCRRMLLNTVASYIPWNWHERRRGEIDFLGERDVACFVDETAQQGLYFFARPGPYICAEWDSGSTPQWLQHLTLAFRTTDPKFLFEVERWYDAVNPIFASRMRSRNGNVILYQIENEDWWCDVDYALALYKMACQDGIDCPIVSNENPKNRGSEIIDTLDDYPLPWQPNSPYMFVPDGMEGKIRKLLYTQPDKPTMHTEFETGWYQEFGDCAPSKWLGEVPAEWIEVLLKSAVAQGINAINMYMIAGGYNPGYWGSKNCTTDRDWMAPIRQWGELNQSFYNVRRLGGMLMTLGEDLVCSEVDEGLVQNPEDVVSVFARRGSESVYLCPRSLTSQTADFRFTVPNVPGLGKLEFPSNAPYHLPGHSMTILPVNVRIHERLPRIIYSTAELFRLFENQEMFSLIAYSWAGSIVELALEGKQFVQGDCQIEQRDGYTVLTVEISEQPKVLRLVADFPIYLCFVDQETAGRCWDFQWKEGFLPLLSNLYLLREDKVMGNTLQMTAEAEPGKDVWLMFPSPKAPLAAQVDDKPVELSYHPENHTASVRFSVEDIQPFTKDLSGQWRMFVEEKESERNRIWKPYRKWCGVEALEIYENGYFLYRTKFKAPTEKAPLTLHLTRFYDEAAVYLNGKFVKAARDHLKCDVSSFVRYGEENDLVIVVEVWGHWEHGFAEESGINGPVLLYSREETVALKHWKRAQVPPYLQPWQLTAPQPQAEASYDDSEWKTVLVDRNWDSRIHGRWRGKEYYWYRSKVHVPASFSAKRIVLDFGECRDDCWVYINGQFVKWFNWFRVPGQPFSLDVTEYIRPGEENTIAVLILVKWHGQGALHRFVQLRATDDLLDQPWQISHGLGGENKGFASVDFDDQHWQAVSLLTVEVPDPHGIIWLRRTFELDLPEGWVIPLGLTMSGFEKKANIYFNGHFLGRYRSEGPQEKFYIPEPWLKSRNVVALSLDGWEPGIKLGCIGLESYPITRPLKIDIHFS